MSFFVLCFSGKCFSVKKFWNLKSTVIFYFGKWFAVKNVLNLKSNCDCDYNAIIYMYSSYARTKYMYSYISCISVLLERSVERENKRLDVVSLTFELRVCLLKRIDKSILAKIYVRIPDTSRNIRHPYDDQPFSYHATCPTSCALRTKDSNIVWMTDMIQPITYVHL